MIRRLAVLGGGSAYAPGLVQALIHRASGLSLDEVRLQDVDAARLDVVARLCRGLARAGGAPFEVRGVGALEEAVEGVDAVLNSTRPGGFPARRLDETLPLEFGIPGQETVGPGGLFYALRSVPETLRVARAMNERAPEALLLNYTNPTNLVTQALADAGFARVLGLCDQSDEDLQALGEALGRPGAAWTFTCSGLNHATWYSELAFGDAPFSGPRRDAVGAPPSWLDEEHRVRFAISCRMAERHPGRWPNSYLAYYEDPAALAACARRTGPRTDAIVPRLGQYYAHFAEEAARDRPVLRMHRGTSGFGDMAVRVLAALGSATPRRIVLNVPNHGATSRFADDTVVEVPVELSERGITRTEVPDLPGTFVELAARLEAYQRTAARAAATGTEETIVEALALNPLVPSARIAAELWARARDAYGSRETRTR